MDIRACLRGICNLFWLLRSSATDKDAIMLANSSSSVVMVSVFTTFWHFVRFAIAKSFYQSAVVTKHARMLIIGIRARLAEKAMQD